MQSPQREPPTYPEDDLFFDAVVRRYVSDNPRFLRRDWLADHVEKRLDAPGCRFVLLVAQPGAGKSAFMSQLADDHLEWLRYFIRRDQRTALGDVSAKSLLLRIGFQLAARHPAAFSRDEISLSVRQRIGEVSNQGELIGAEIERLTASPFYKVVMQIEQSVRSNQGRTVGLKVDELVVESRLLTDVDLLHLALVDPAKVLQRRDPTQRITILIDALDEISYHATTDDILTWLTNCPALPENVRFVITSRTADERLKLFCDKQASNLSELIIDQHDSNVSRDVEKFIEGLIGEKPLAQALAQTEGGVEAFGRKAAAKAHGNLGYLDALARGIEQAYLQNEPQTLRALLTLNELPADLEGLYSFFLHQIKATAGRERVELRNSSGETYDQPVWPAVYSKVLGVLAIAMEPLDLKQIERLAKIRVERAWLIQALERLVQFLDVAQNRYRFYHATVAEFLTAERTAESTHTGDLYQDPRFWHEQIADYYFNTHKGDWHDCDRYGLSYLASHLFEAKDAHRLQQLLCPSNQSENAWYAAKLIAGDLDGWQTDVERALQLAKQNAAIDLQFRYALCLSSVRSVKVPAALLDICLQEKVLDWPQALSQARLHQDPATRAKEIARLGTSLPDKVRGRLVVDEFKSALALKDERLQVDVAVALASYLPARHFKELFAAATEITEDRILAKLIVAYAPRLSQHYFDKAVELARSIQDPVPRLRSFGALALRLARPRILLDEARSSSAEKELTGDHVCALCETAHQLRGRLRRALLDDAFEIAKQLDYGTGLAGALAAFVQPGISRVRIGEILELAWQTFERTYRDPNSSSAPGTIRDGYILILGTLGPLLTENQRKKFVEGMVNELQGYPDMMDIVHSDVPLLAPYLPKDQRFDACAKFTGWLIRNVDRSHWPWTWRNDATLNALEQWPEQLLDTALAEVQRLKKAYHRAQLLRVIVRRLPQGRRAAILRGEFARVGEIGDRGARAAVLAALVANVPVNERAKISEEALELLDRNWGYEEQMEIIATVARHVSPERGAAILDQALVTIRDEVSGSRSKALAVAALANSLPKPMISRALEIVSSLADNEHLAISAFIGSLPKEQRPAIIDRCLKAVQGVLTAELPGDTVKVLQALAPHLSPDQATWGFEIANTITLHHPKEKAEALAALGSGLHGTEGEELNLESELLHATLAIEDDEKRAAALCELLPRLLGAAKLEAFYAMLRSCLGVRGWQVPRQRIERRFLLECVGKVAGTIKDIGGEGAALQFALAINETAVWWP